MKLRVSVARQRMTLLADDGQTVREYPVSTAAAGVGERAGSAAAVGCPE